jgi:hypothetical protein
VVFVWIFIINFAYAWGKCSAILACHLTR